MSDAIVRVPSSGRDELRQQIQGLLRDYNTSHGVKSPDAMPLTAVAENRKGEVLGGCIAEVYWGWLVIDVLAVDESVRNQGVGTRLVDEVEAEARRMGCTKAHTTAYDFQGLRFWLKRGYESVGELADYPPGHTTYWLTRPL